MTITVNPKKVVVILAIITICLIAADIAGIVSKYYFGSSRLGLFDLDREANIPAFYSSIAILLCAGLLTILAITKKKQEEREYLYWTGLAIIFLFLSFDEAALLHERLKGPFKNLFDTSGILYFAWVIPYGIFVIAIVTIYLRFVFSLPKKIRNLIISSGIIYVTGALGLELIGAYWFELYGPENVTYQLMTLCEESLEMVGILVFIYTLLSYITSELDVLCFNIGSSD